MPRAYLFGAIRSLREDPVNLNSADAEFIVAGEDTMDYVVKTVNKHPAIPASEWICHNIADACNISTPQFALVELTDGRIGFGSQWDSSAVVDQAVRNRVATSIPGVKGLAPQFSAIYALDLFLHNADRHFGNYFIVNTHKSLGIKAYDFSRALLFNGWPLPDLPLPPGCNTYSCYKSLRVAYPYMESIGDEVVRRLRNITQDQLREWVEEMPEQWLASGARSELMEWWNDGAQERLTKVEEGLRNGKFL